MAYKDRHPSHTFLCSVYHGQRNEMHIKNLKNLTIILTWNVLASEGFLNISPCLGAAPLIRKALPWGFRGSFNFQLPEIIPLLYNYLDLVSSDKCIRKHSYKVTKCSVV